VIALDPGTITTIQGVGFLDSGIRFISTPIEKPKPAGKKRKQLSSQIEEKEEKSPFFRMTRTHA
jgi:hypothetical protein